jgi:hypothetical protein
MGRRMNPPTMYFVDAQLWLAIEHRSSFLNGRELINMRGASVRGVLAVAL